MKNHQKLFLVITLLFSFQTFALDLIPTTKDNNMLYYKMGGASDFSLPKTNDVGNGL